MALLYPGYDPSEDVKGFYPGQGMTRTPSYVPSLHSGDFGAAFEGIINDIDYAVGDNIEPYANLPKWVWKRKMDDFHNAWNVAVYPSNVDPTELDDYEGRTAPGAYGIALNLDPVEWLKDPEKQLKKSAGKFVENVFNVSDLERRAEDTFWRRATAADPTAVAGTTGWDDLLRGQYDKMAERYGAPEVDKGNRIALQGLSDKTKRVVNMSFVDADTGWTGIRGASGVARRSIDQFYATQVPQATSNPNNFGMIHIGDITRHDATITVDTGENLRSAWHDFQENRETPLFRDGSYQKLMNANTDFVATNLHNLKRDPTKNLSSDELSFINSYLTQANYLNAHNALGEKFSKFSKSLAEARFPGRNLTTKEDLITATGIETFHKQIQEGRDALRETRERLERFDPQQLREFNRTVGSLDRDLKKLQSVLGKINDDGTFTLSESAQRFIDGSFPGATGDFYKEVSLYLGSSRTGLMKRHWGTCSLRPGTDFQLSQRMGNGLITGATKGKGSFASLVEEHDLESGRALFYTKLARSQRSYGTWEEVMKAIQKSNIGESYLWNKGFKQVFNTGYLIANPDEIVKRFLIKTHGLGLKVMDKGQFDKFDELVKKRAPWAKKLFANEFKLKTKAGKLVKFQGSKNLKGIKDITSLLGDPQGKEALKRMLNGAKLIDGDYINPELIKLIFHDKLPDNLDLETLKSDLEKLQKNVTGFKEWLKANGNKLGIRDFEDMDAISNILQQLGHHDRMIKVSREYAGVLERITKVGNQIQMWAFDNIPILSDVVKGIGLAKTALKNFVKETVEKALEKMLSKSAMAALFQALGTSVAPIIGNIAAWVATEVAEKVVNKVFGGVKDTLEKAWNLLKGEDIGDIMEELDEKMEKNVKKLIWILLAFFGLTILFGSFSTLLLAPLGLTPSITGGLLGSATITQMTNLNANPYVVILSTFSDADPSRQVGVMPQTEDTWDWMDLYPPSGAGPSSLIVSPPQGGSVALTCLDGTTEITTPDDLPEAPIGAEPPATGYPIATRAYNVASQLKGGFWCWNNFSPMHCLWDGSDCNTPRDSPPGTGIFFWNEFLATPDPCYSYMGHTTANSSCTNVNWIGNDGDLFWCNDLIEDAYNVNYDSTDPNSIYIPGNTMGLQSGAFAAKDQLMYAPSFDTSRLRPGDMVFFGTVAHPSHVAVISHVHASGGVTVVESNTRVKSKMLTLGTDGYLRSPGGSIVVMYGIFEDLSLR